MAKTPAFRTRLFVALELPEAVRARVGRVLAPDDALRPVAPHVTLVFLGWQTEVERIASITEQAGQAQPITLVPKGVRAVPPRRPRLLALDLEDPGGQCAALHASLAGALAEAGLYRPEKRPFWPHATLARVRRGHKARAPADVGPLPAAFVADRVVLFRSILGREGAVYEPVRVTTLGT